MLGEKLKALRKETGLSQDYVAEKLFVSRATVYRWENNKAVPSASELNKLAEMLNTDIQYLLSDDVEDHKDETNTYNEDAIAKVLGRMNYILSEREADRKKKNRRIIIFIVFLFIAFVVFKIIRVIILKN